MFVPIYQGKPIDTVEGFTIRVVYVENEDVLTDVLTTIPAPLQVTRYRNPGSQHWYYRIFVLCDSSTPEAFLVKDGFWDYEYRMYDYPVNTTMKAIFPYYSIYPEDEVECQLEISNLVWGWCIWTIDENKEIKTVEFNLEEVLNA